MAATSSERRTVFGSLESVHRFSAGLVLGPQRLSGFRIDQMNSRADRTCYGPKRIVFILGRVARDKALHAIAGHRTSIEESGHKIVIEGLARVINSGNLRRTGHPRGTRIVGCCTQDLF